MRVCVCVCEWGRRTTTWCEAHGGVDRPHDHSYRHANATTHVTATTITAATTSATTSTTQAARCSYTPAYSHPGTRWTRPLVPSKLSPRRPLIEQRVRMARTWESSSSCCNDQTSPPGGTLAVSIGLTGWSGRLPTVKRLASARSRGSPAVRNVCRRATRSVAAAPHVDCEQEVCLLRARIVTRSRGCSRVALAPCVQQQK